MSWRLPLPLASTVQMFVPAESVPETYASRPPAGAQAGSNWLPLRTVTCFSALPLMFMTQICVPLVPRLLENATRRPLGEVAG